MMSLNPPFPTTSRCRPAKGLSLAGRLGSEAEPSVRPLVWKAAPGALPEESLAALRTAAVRAEGLAPRMVSTTDDDFMTRKVGMLMQLLIGQLLRVPTDSRADAIFACHFLLAVDIDLDKLQLAWLRFLFRERLENGRNGFAGPAPVGVEVNNCICRLREERGEMAA